MPSQEQKKSSGEWLIEQLGILAVSKGAPQTQERLAANAADLVDIPQEVMREVFVRARREPTFGYPQVSDLRKLAGIQPAQTEAQEADRAWVWLLGEYIPKFGVYGRDRVTLAMNPEERAKCEKCRTTGWVTEPQESTRVVMGPGGKEELVSRTTDVARRCDCSRTVTEKAPAIPPRLHYTLQQLATSVEAAMLRMLECEPEYQGVLRKEFTAAYERAIEVERSGELLLPSNEPLKLPDEFRQDFQRLKGRTL
jgi:hypothetical protein